MATRIEGLHGDMPAGEAAAIILEAKAAKMFALEEAAASVVLPQHRYESQGAAHSGSCVDSSRASPGFLRVGWDQLKFGSRQQDYAIQCEDLRDSCF